MDRVRFVCISIMLLITCITLAAGAFCLKTGYDKGMLDGGRLARSARREPVIKLTGWLMKADGAMTDIIVDGNLKARFYCPKGASVSGINSATPIAIKHSLGFASGNSRVWFELITDQR